MYYTSLPLFDKAVSNRSIPITGSKFHFSRETLELLTGEEDNRNE